MRSRSLTPLYVVLLLHSSSLGRAQGIATLTLDEAEKLALQKNPRESLPQHLTRKRTGATVAQVRSAFQPLLTANLTTAGADRDIGYRCRPTANIRPD